MEAFYIGKGKDKRLFAHLTESDDSKKSQRIQEIENENLEPIIKILASGCSEEEAFLIESTLIWWNEDKLLNKASGHKNDIFRPNVKFTLLKNLNGFDFKSGLYLVNCGDGNTRRWEDFHSYGFISAGHDPKWSLPLKRLKVGDIIVSYLKGDGYIGIGRVVQESIQAKRFITSQGLSLFQCSDLLSPDLFHDSNDPVSAEYCVGINWIKAFSRGNGKFESKTGLYTTPQIVTSLFNQKKTVEFLENEFKIDLMALIL
jgi:uncharacterized protein